jgi:hypothetical protein
MKRSSLAAGAALAALTATVLPPAWGGADVDAQATARVWVDGERSDFRRGEHGTVRFSVRDDAYVAVVHVDTDGNMDFLYPASPWDGGFVRGGRVHTAAPRSGGRFVVRGSPGIGYFFLLASADPLDFSAFRASGFSAWEWGYAGRVVRGDPFFAFEQVTRALLPRGRYSRYVVDSYSYYVDGFHRYPSYACASRGHLTGWNAGWGWTPAYGSCDRLVSFLRSDPYYYDTRRYRGDRRTYWREYQDLDPRHGFKEAPDRPARTDTRPAVQQPRQDGRGTPAPAAEGVPRRDPAPAAAPRSGASGRSGDSPPPRPATERRPEEPAATPRARPTPETGSRGATPTRDTAPAGGSGSTTPARRPEPR